MPPSEPDIPEDPDSPFIRTPTPPAFLAEKPKNPIHKSANADTFSHRTMSAASTLLQTPPIDTNETIDLDPEVFFDKAKRLQYFTRKNKERQKEPSMQETVPLMVKCGDPEIDHHMAFCTRWDPLDIHEERQKFRQMTWLEYEKCVELCEQKGIPLTGNIMQYLRNA